MSYTDDPLHDFALYDREQQRRLQQLPVCQNCLEPIQDDFFFEDINGMDIVCETCLMEHRRATDDYIE